MEELESSDTPEARLAQDADQLDLILNLKEQLDLGNAQAQKWLDAAVKRLRTPQGQALAEKVLATDHSDWWFVGPDAAWWERKNGGGRLRPGRTNSLAQGKGAVITRQGLPRRGCGQPGTQASV